MTLFQRSFLGLFAVGILLIAFVLTAKGTAVAAVAPPAGPAVLNTIAGDSNGGIARGLVTTGAGYVKARPDMVEVSLGVTATAETAAAAQSAIAEREARVLDRAAKLGIPARDTKTASYRIDPQYSYQPGTPARITGYLAQETVIVIVRDVEAIGAALDTFVQDEGAMTTTIRFTLSDPKAPQAQARDLAIADARAKAEAMAKAAGIKLGRIVAIADALLPPQSNIDRTTYTQLVKSPTQIPVSDLDVNVSVQVQFETD
ncbi:MAG: SIMPL domain-containing protein [Chloroflexota bacterium]|nr:SIMPL domain-containing protein [Chloroflexota bacterium]